MSTAWRYPTVAHVMAHAFNAHAANEVSYCRRYALTVIELSEPADPEKARLCKTCQRKEPK